MKLQPFAVVLALGAAAFAGACSTPTTIAETWRDPDYAAAPMHDVLVIARLRTEANRRTAEDAYVAALAQHGVRATASYQVFQQQRPDRSEVRAYLARQGYDGALVTRFEGIRSETTIVPDADFSGYYGGLWGPADSYYLETDQYVRVETSLWDARSGRLVWSATSETENPSSSRDAISSVVRKITSSLANEKLIPPATSGARVSSLARAPLGD